METSRIIVTDKNLTTYTGDLLVFFAIQKKKTGLPVMILSKSR